MRASLSLESESNNRRPDCPYKHQELRESQFPTSRFQAPKCSNMQEKSANDKKQQATDLHETKLEFRFSHLLSVALARRVGSVTDETAL